MVAGKIRRIIPETVLECSAMDGLVRGRHPDEGQDPRKLAKIPACAGMTSEGEISPHHAALGAFLWTHVAHADAGNFHWGGHSVAAEGLA